MLQELKSGRTSQSGLNFWFKAAALLIHLVTLKTAMWIKDGMSIWNNNLIWMAIVQEFLKALSFQLKDLALSLTHMVVIWDSPIESKILQNTKSSEFWLMVIWSGCRRMTPFLDRKIVSTSIQLLTEQKTILLNISKAIYFLLEPTPMRFQS